MAKERVNSEEALLGEIEVPLELGGAAFIKPWGIKTARRMMRRIKIILTIGLGAASGNLDMADILDSSYGEILSLVSDSLGITVEELEDEDKYTLADLLAIIDAIVRVNFLERPGLLKNFNGLLVTINTLIPQEAVAKAASDAEASEKSSETPTPSPQP